MKKIASLILFTATLFYACSPKESITQTSVKEVVDGVVTRLYADFTPAQLDTVGEAFILQYLSESEKEVLSTKYWEFSVDQPVTVSLMRDQKQGSVPFWLESSGFVKTALTLKNEISTYEVWQKDFPKGTVSLGINGFDKHRPVYFVSVSPQTRGKSLNITPIFPAAQHIDTLRQGAFTYHDWDGLKLDEVPESLHGQLLLTTIRGRAREAHLIKAFRQTKYPSSEHPDQVVLTHYADPSNSIAVQWRSSQQEEGGQVAYWIENTVNKDTLRKSAVRKILEDRLLNNDRYISRFTAQLENLQPGQRYGYYVEDSGGRKSEPSFFKTADSPAASGHGQFEFIWFGDTHNNAGWGETITYSDKRFPETDFYIHSGDVVNTGLHRDDWDEYFHYSGRAYTHVPMMAVPGNHDSQDGLGAWMYQDLLRYPAGGPTGFSSGLTYAFRYENALFLMMDAASIPVEAQQDWIEQQLAASSDTDWKFLVVHFPPYNEVEPYPEIVASWSPVLDKYGVDAVMSGHFHYYMRTQPLKAGKPDLAGVHYLMSVGTSASREAKSGQPFVVKRHEQGNLFQRFEINGKELRYTAYDKTGKEIDRMEIRK